MDKVKVAAEHKNAEGGLLAVKALAETKHSAAEAYVVAMLPILMDKYADKVLDRPCQNWHNCIITLMFCCWALSSFFWHTWLKLFAEAV